MSKFATFLSLMIAFPIANIAKADDSATHLGQVVVNASVGGGLDAIGRLLAKQLSDDLNQTFTVLNKDGAAALQGARVVANAKPDGNTILIASVEMAISPVLIHGGGNPFDVERELIPISFVGDTPFVIAVNKDIPVGNPRELVDYIKQHDNKFTWGTGGVATPNELAIKQFDKVAGIKPLLVPFPGLGPTMVSLLGGEINGAFPTAPLVKSNIASGRLKALAITSKDMSEWMPDLPTVSSFGFAGYESSAWYGIWAPKGMSKELVARTHAEITKALSAPEVQTKLRAIGLTVSSSKSPQEFAGFYRDQLEKNKILIQSEM